MRLEPYLGRPDHIAGQRPGSSSKSEEPNYERPDDLTGQRPASESQAAFPEEADNMNVDVDDGGEVDEVQVMMIVVMVMVVVLVMDDDDAIIQCFSAVMQ